MCYSPMHISRYSNGKYAYDVPCGHCEQCRETRVNDITFRIWYEFSTLNNEYERITGKKSSRGLFCTLTFNDVNLPRCFVNEYFQPVFSPLGELLNSPKRAKYITCWNKAFMQRFFKTMNDKLIYYIGTKVFGIKRLENGRITPEWRAFLDSYNKRPIKYFLVCERGKRNTCRPHYHVIILLNDVNLSLTYVKQFIRDNWTYGFSYNLTVGGNRSDFDCIKYVCKYVLKDSKEYLCNPNLVFESEEARKNAQPFVLQSNFLGACYLQNVSMDNLHYLCEHGVTLGGKNPIPMALPRYYRKKIATLKSFDDFLNGNFDYLLDNRHTSSGELRKLPALVPFDYHSRTLNNCPELHPNSYGVYNKNHLEFTNDVELGTQSYLFDNFETYSQYMSKKRVCTPLSSYGVRLQEYSAERSAKYFCDLLDVVKVDKSFFNLYSGIPEFIDIDTISKRKLSFFIRKGLYRHFDNGENLEKIQLYPETAKLYAVYIALRNYKSYLAFVKNKTHQFEYASQLSDVMSNKPELFQNYVL